MTQKVVITVIAVAVVAFSLGRFASPKSVETKEVEKIVYVESKKKEREQSVTEKETRLPDGTVIKEKTKETKVRSESEKEVQSLKVSESKTTNRPSWRIGFGYEVPSEDLHEVYYSLTIERRLFGEIYLGGMVDTQKHIGLTINIGF